MQVPQAHDLSTGSQDEMEAKLARNPLKAVAYYRTSSATNVGPEKDSLARQRSAVEAYATAQGINIVGEYYDPAVSGAEPLDQRPGFAELLQHVAGNGIGAVLIEDPTRFARDLAVQLTGHERLRDLGVELVPANAPEHFREDTPTAVLIRQVLGAIAQFEKTQTVAKLKAARDRRSQALGRRVEGRKAVPEDVIAAARKLARRSPKTGKRRSLRAIAQALAESGMTGPGGKPYGPESVKRMLR